MLAAPDGADNYFGEHVSGGDFNGDGSPDLAITDETVNNNTGAVYVYFGPSSHLVSPPDAVLPGPGGEGQYFGGTVANAGDLNGDGCADIVVGDLYFGSCGRAYVYLGNPDSLAASPAVTLSNPTPTNLDQFGISVAGAGDVNGDGYGDLIVGSSGPSSGTGNAYVYLGLASFPAITLTPPALVGANFGFSVMGLGDTDGDGYADVIVGAAAIFEKAGAAYVFSGSASGSVSPAAAVTLVGPDPGGTFGSSVAFKDDQPGAGRLPSSRARDDLPAVFTPHVTGQGAERQSVPHAWPSSAMSWPYCSNTRASREIPALACHAARDRREGPASRAL